MDEEFIVLIVVHLEWLVIVGILYYLIGDWFVIVPWIVSLLILYAMISIAWRFDE